MTNDVFVAWMVAPWIAVAFCYGIYRYTIWQVERDEAQTPTK